MVKSSLNEHTMMGGVDKRVRSSYRSVWVYKTKSGWGLSLSGVLAPIYSSLFVQRSRCGNHCPVTYIQACCMAVNDSTH